MSVNNLSTWLSITIHHYHLFSSSTPSTTNHCSYLFEGLAEEDQLHLIVDGQDTGTGNTTENVGTCTLEERLNTLLGDDLAGGIHGSLVLDGLTGGHHHATTDSIKRVRSDTSTSGDGPSESERGKEVTLKRADKENWLDGIVHSEVETTVNDNAENGWAETTVETSNTIGSESLLVNIDQAVELAVTTLLGVLGIVGKTGTGVIEGVDEEEGSGTSGLYRISSCINREKNAATYTTGGKVTGHPLCVSITILLVGEHALVGITESKVKCLGWEVTDDVGSVSSPQGCETLLVDGTLEALADAIVLPVETTGLQHLIL
jgi:hypothetical protein